MLRKIILGILRQKGYDLVKTRHTIEGRSVLLKPLDLIGVELLGDRKFQDSCAEVYDLTLLDTPRLANLWQLCRETDPAGNILEVGVYRGGSALHLANSSPERLLFACDSFSGFGTLDERLDHAFDQKMFKDTSKEAVERLLTSRDRKIKVIQGFFPVSCASIDLGQISFVHLDVDLFEATRDTLNWLAGKMMSRSLIVIDDYSRTADGVNKAVQGFIKSRPDWIAIPLFPSQALLIPQTWFNAGGTSAR